MNDERRTPRWLYDKISERFRFSIDLAATAENALCDRYYTKEDSAFDHSWDGELAWCNPPYSNIRPWVVRAIESKGTVLMLIPGDCSTKAGQLVLQHCHILFINRRIVFAKFASWLVLFNGDRADVNRLRLLDMGVVL